MKRVGYTSGSLAVNIHNAFDRANAHQAYAIGGRRKSYKALSPSLTLQTFGL